MAAAYGVAALVDELLHVGVNPNVMNSVGWTPLHEGQSCFPIVDLCS